MRAVVVVGKVWRELFEDFAGTLPIVRAGRTKYNSGSIFKSRLPKHYTPLHLYIPTHHQDFIYYKVQTVVITSQFFAHLLLYFAITLHRMNTAVHLLMRY
jgi:hypothetical protein